MAMATRASSWAKRMCIDGRVASQAPTCSRAAGVLAEGARISPSTRRRPRCRRGKRLHAASCAGRDR
eukprot:506420-Pyramimonas_sp.AAC.1